MTRPRQAVILAGGRGTRLRPYTDHRPKAMVEINGRPFLEYLIEQLRDQGFERVLLLLGYLPQVVINHFGDGGRFGVEIRYGVTAPDDLTAKRVLEAANELEQRFLLLYCDNYWPMQFDRMWDFYRRSGAEAMITVYGNRDSYSRDSVIVGPDGRVRVFDRSRTTPGLRGVEIGYAILSRAILPLLGDGSQLVEDAVYPALTARGALAAYVSDHRYYSVGSPERLPLTREFLARRPAVLLDRDGVLNAKPPRAQYVRTASDFQWLPGAREALAVYCEAGYRVIVISNQAGIARGALRPQDLDAVHARMREEAAAAGGRIDAIYVCPHDWDEGCECRKPKPGMLYAAQRDHHLDLTRTAFVGDDDRDGEAARAAGCPFEQVTESRPLLGIARAMAQPAVAAA